MVWVCVSMEKGPVDRENVNAAASTRPVSLHSNHQLSSVIHSNLFQGQGVILTLYMDSASLQSQIYGTG